MAVLKSGMLSAMTQEAILYEGTAPETWIDTHRVHYDLLFEEGQLSEEAVRKNLSIPELSGSVAISALARYRDKRKRLSPIVANSITAAVQETFDACSTEYFDEEVAFLHDIEWPQRARLAVITTQVISAWVRGGSYFKNRSPYFKELYYWKGLQTKDSNVGLVPCILMAAASLRYVCDEIPPLLKSGSVLSWVNSVATHGPLYTRELIGKPNGNEKHDGSSTTHQSAFSVASLKEVLGWDEVKTKSKATLTNRLHWANAAHEPEAVLEDLRHLDTILSHESIARELGISVEQSEAIFTPSAIGRFYRAPWVDPLPRLHAIIGRIRDLTNTHGMPYSIACWLAINVPSDANRRAEIAQQTVDLRLGGVAHSQIYPVVRNPDSTEDQEAFSKKSQDEAYAYHSARKPLSIHNAFEGRGVEIGDTTYAPEAVLFREETVSPSGKLEKLLGTSGLDKSQITELLSFFKEEPEDIPSHIEELLEVLRRIV